jgi:hypothetical protein
MGQQQTRRRGRPSKYDWDKYANGDEHFCYPGVDFQCAPSSFRALVYRTASVRGLDKTVHLDSNTGLVRFRMFEGSNARH